MIINGRKISEKILLRLKNKIEKENLRLKLAVVLVGNDPNSKVYVKRKQEACGRVGIDFHLFQFPEQIQGAKLVKEIKKILKQDISGIVIQLPLPKHINTDEILNIIPKEKDAEFISPVVCAIEYILEEYNLSLKDKKIALIGKGRLVGIPVAEWLEKQGLEFSNNTEDADIIISGVGKPNLIKKDMVKNNVIIIDVGGDVDQEVSQKASYMTPLIGGVGPVTVACLLENLIKN